MSIALHFVTVNGEMGTCAQFIISKTINENLH